MKLLFSDFTLPYLLRDSEYPVGGWAVQLSSWLKGLAACNHRAGVLTWKGARDYVGPDAGCDLLDTYDPAKGVKVLKYFYSHIPAMLAAARAYEPDVLVQACAGVHTGIMASIARRLSVPFVYRVTHDADTDDRLSEIVPQRYARISYRFGLGSAAAILCQNQYQFDHLKPQNLNARLGIIHNPFAIDRALSSLPEETRGYIAWLAVFRDAKNLPLLVRLAGRLPNIKFRVAGMAEASSSQSVHDAIAALRTLPNVEMAGYVRRNDVWKFLSGARALLSTSDSEGFSNTILESLAVGTPMILRRQVDPDHIISTHGLGIAAADENELALRLEEIWTMEPEHYAAMSRRCFDYVRRHHDPIAKVQELMSVLDPIVSDRRSHHAIMAGASSG